MLPRSHLSESRPSSTAGASNDGISRECPSCHEGVDLEQQPACRCGYRVCHACWQIAANFGGACPCCGWPPDPESIRELGIVRLNNERVVGNSSRSSSSSGSNTPGRTDHHQQQQPGSATASRQRSSSTSGGAGGQQPHQGVFIRGADRRVLQNLRVIQRTLVYAIGLTPTIAQASTLKEPVYFGQYGEITKLVINHHHGVSPEDPRYGSASAYITFSRQEDAWAAICSVDGFRLMGRTIRASFGTTKYCNSFLRNLPCNNPECLYLHELGDEEDRFTKDEVQLGLARHGSSFAFKEEVLGTSGDRDSGGGSLTRNGNRTGGSGQQPLNPVLPPPCPRTPPRPVAAHANHTYSSSYEGSRSGGVGVLGGGSGDGSFGHRCLPCTTSPTRWSVDQQGKAMPGCAGARGLIGAGPVSPGPVGADGRPRPRRRRGQRGRRGGGGGVNGNGTPGSNETGRSGLGGDTEALSGRTCDKDEECVYGPAGLCLVAPQAERGQSDGYGPGSSLTVTNVEQLAKVSGCPRTICSAVCMPARPPSSSSLSTSKFLRLDDQDMHDGGGCAGSECGDLAALAGPNNGTFIGCGSSNDGLCHPAPKQPSTWEGSERSVGSNRSAGGSGYGGGAGRSSSSSHWGKPYSAGRGSPHDTPETLTNTPPVEPSPSEPTSSLAMSASFPGLSSLSSRGLWDLGIMGTSGGRNSSGACAKDERGMESSGSGARVGTGVYSHRSLRVRSPPAFFGLSTDDGRGGDSLVSISETRQQPEQFQQARSQSLDLSLERHNDGRQQQEHKNNLHQWHADGIDGGSASLLRHASHGGTQRSNEGLSTFVTVTNRSTATAPPGLTPLFANVGGGNERDDEASGGRHSDDRFTTEGRYSEGSSARDTRAGRWDVGGNEQIGTRYGVVGGGGGGGGKSRMGFSGDTDEEETWATQAALMAFDPFSSSNTTTASQDEASRWRRATPRLFA